MGKKKAAGRRSGVNKSELIREAIAALGGGDPDVKVIQAYLKENNNLDVGQALIYNVKANSKKRAGAPVGRRGRQPKAASAITLDKLYEVKKIVDSLGGLEQAKKALEALQSLST